MRTTIEQTSQVAIRSSIRNEKTNGLESKGDDPMSEQEDQLAIYAEMAGSLIEATPEWWSHATLELVASPEGLGQGVSHSISNEDYPQDVVVATDEIMASTRKLELLSVKNSDSWKRCVFRIRQDGENWRFSTEYER